MTIKAIDTTYNGYRFRSRLEARWAVFLDSLGVPYEYEKEGFDVDGTWYLPDFWLPEQKYWLEIKPGPHSDWPKHVVFEWMWAHETDEFQGGKFHVLRGDPWIEPDHRSYYDLSYEAYIVGDLGYLWCECPECGFVGLQFEGRGGRMPCHRDPTDEHITTTHTTRLLAAYQAARQARFEHGARA